MSENVADNTIYDCDLCFRRDMRLKCAHQQLDYARKSHKEKESSGTSFAVEAAERYLAQALSFIRTVE